MKRVLVSIAAVMLMVAPAAAADMPARMPVKAPPPVAVAGSWTGCYVGANGGYGWSRENWFDLIVFADEGSHTGRGPMLGGQIGCDYQSGRFVFGIQGLADWTDITGSHPYTDDPNYTDHNRIRWLATLTGRVGYTLQPETLVYVKGGAAFVRNRLRETCAPAVDPSCPAVATVSRTGWTVGVGAEHRFLPNWSLFAEYNYAGFGRDAATLTYVDGTTWTYDIRQNVHFVLVGVNYRFGGPVVARY